uniref:Uncharacterized protein LOC110215323 n=1 Tax=Phascolarctos cinereus TaxID=38626 RepID=A0A6P5L3K1_PHACI|nr:uncharacterized protein LOC110215323 [Phascolarctos cinereus]
MRTSLSWPPHYFSQQPVVADNQAASRDVTSATTTCLPPETSRFQVSAVFCCLRPLGSPGALFECGPWVSPGQGETPPGTEPGSSSTPHVYWPCRSGQVAPNVGLEVRTSARRTSIERRFVATPSFSLLMKSPCVLKMTILVIFLLFRGSHGGFQSPDPVALSRALFGSPCDWAGARSLSVPPPTRKKWTAGKRQPTSPTVILSRASPNPSGNALRLLLKTPSISITTNLLRQKILLIPWKRVSSSRSSCIRNLAARGGGEILRIKSDLAAVREPMTGILRSHVSKKSAAAVVSP